MSPTAPTAPTPAVNPKDLPQLSMRTVLRGAGIGMVIALVLNLIVYVLGNLGAPLQVVMQGKSVPSKLSFVAVAFATFFSITVGSIFLIVLARFRKNAIRTWEIVAVVVAVVSVGSPLGLDVSTESKVALSIMHVLVGAGAITGHRVAQGRAAGTK